jgi:hypothetical protein
MATYLNATALDALLGGTFAPDGVSLHSGAPGAGGDGNVVKAAVAATFAAGSSDGGTKRKRALSSPVNITGATESANVVNIGLWGSTQSVYYGYITRTAGDATTNAAGEYTLTTDTKITIDNAA